MREQVIQVDGGSVAVRVHGSGQPVIFLHGVLTNGTIWDEVVRAASAPMTAVLPDLPLGSHRQPIDPAAELTFPAVAEMVVQIADELGLERPVLVANDSGGVLTQYLLVHHGDRFGGALFTSSDAFDNFPPKFFWWFAPLLRVPGAVWLASRLFHVGPLRRSPLMLGRLVRRRLRDDEVQALLGPLRDDPRTRSDLRRLARTMHRSVTEELAAGLRDFGGPVDVAWSADDPIFPEAHAARLAGSFPRGREVAAIAGARCFSPLDQPVAVAERLDALLARVRPMVS